jgi:hypothetical protein
MRWSDFAAHAPALAEHGARLLAERHGYAYLATTAADGSPRVHLADLRHEPRLALHATVLPPDDEEFALRGTAVEVAEADRDGAVAGAVDGARLSPHLVLFEVDLTEASWARWSDGTPTRERWRET